MSKSLTLRNENSKKIKPWKTSIRMDRLPPFLYLIVNKNPIVLKMLEQSEYKFFGKATYTRILSTVVIETCQRYHQNSTSTLFSEIFSLSYKKKLLYFNFYNYNDTYCLQEVPVKSFSKIQHGNYLLLLYSLKLNKQSYFNCLSLDLLKIILLFVDRCSFGLYFNDYNHVLYKGYEAFCYNITSYKHYPEEYRGLY
jgi:hypothetical protein